MVNLSHLWKEHMSENNHLYSPAAEDGLLAVCIIDPANLDKIDTRSSDFYIAKNVIIFDCLETIYKRGLEPDVITLGTELDRRGKLAEIGGPAELTRLLTSPAQSWHAEEYSRIVKDKAMRRHVVKVASDLVNQVYQGDELSESVSDAMGELTNAAGVTNGAQHINKYVSEAYDFITARAANPGDFWGIPTGFADYDKITGGLQAEELLIISGEPGRGKSISVGQMAIQLGLSQHPGAVYSLEMRGRSYLLRILSGLTKIKTRNFKTGAMNGELWDKVNQAVETMGEIPIYMSDSTIWNTTSLRADLARLKEQHGIEWFIVDYSAMLTDKAENELQKLMIVIRNLKITCRALGLAGVVIHSMNKGGVDNLNAGQANLSGPAQVLYDADVIMLLLEHRPIMGKSDPNMITCAVKKGRDIDSVQPFFHLVKLPGLPWFGDYVRE